MKTTPVPEELPVGCIEFLWITFNKEVLYNKMRLLCNTAATFVLFQGCFGFPNNYRSLTLGLGLARAWIDSAPPIVEAQRMQNWKRCWLQCMVKCLESLMPIASHLQSAALSSLSQLGGRELSGHPYSPLLIFVPPKIPGNIKKLSASLPALGCPGQVMGLSMASANLVDCGA